MLEVLRVADAAQLAVGLPVRVQTLHDELGHLRATHTHTHRLVEEENYIYIGNTGVI